MSLDSALETLPDDPVTALRTLLLVWEERRATEIADAIAALDARLAAGRPAPAPPTTTEDAAWIAIARKRDLVDVGRLLAVPFHPNPHWTGQRLTTLVKYHGFDARISAAVLATMAHDGGKQHGLWFVLMPLLKRFADPRAPGVLREIAARIGKGKPHAPIAAAMTETAGRIERAVAKRPALSTDERSTLATLARAIARVPEGAAAMPPSSAKAKVTRATAKTKPARSQQGGDLATILGRADRDLEAAMVVLVELWRATRDPGVAALLEQLGPRLVRPALPDRPVAAALSAWRDCLHAGDPLDADRLVAALRIGTSKQIIERLRALAGAPAHPRFADAAIALLRDQPFSSRSTRPVYTAAVDLLVAQRDPRTRARLEDIQQHRMPGLGLDGGVDFRDFFAAKIARALAAARDVGPAAALATGDREAIDQARRRFAAPSPDDQAADELLAAIWAAPADDGPRLVYADWAQERGLPHGELISLQIARSQGTTSAAARARENALIDAHWRELVGPLAPAIQRTGLVFERGFVVHAEIPEKRSPQITELASHRAWATLKSFYAWNAARRYYPQLLAHLEKLGATDLKRYQAKKRYA